MALDNFALNILLLLPPGITTGAILCALMVRFLSKQKKLGEERKKHEMPVVKQFLVVIGLCVAVCFILFVIGRLI